MVSQQCAVLSDHAEIQNGRREDRNWWETLVALVKKADGNSDDDSRTDWRDESIVAYATNHDQQEGEKKHNNKVLHLRSCLNFSILLITNMIIWRKALGTRLHLNCKSPRQHAEKPTDCSRNRVIISRQRSFCLYFPPTLLSYVKERRDKQRGAKPAEGNSF